MIKETARAFVHQESVGDLERSRAVIYALKKKADQLYAQKVTVHSPLFQKRKSPTFIEKVRLLDFPSFGFSN
ncbi:MAG: hypothetical protein ACPGWR_05075 [Ardenticatenaceae bacterium]